MSDQSPFQPDPLTPEQLANLAKAEAHNITYPVCLALRALGLGHLEDHLHSVHVFEMVGGQLAFGFGWCKASHVDPENLTPVELAGIRSIVRAALEMKGHDVVEQEGKLYISRDGALSLVGLPGGGNSKNIDDEVERFRRELDKTLGPPANKLPPDDPMSRWMP